MGNIMGVKYTAVLHSFCSSFSNFQTSTATDLSFSKTHLQNESMLVREILSFPSRHEKCSLATRCQGHVPISCFYNLTLAVPHDYFGKAVFCFKHKMVLCILIFG